MSKTFAINGLQKMPQHLKHVATLLMKQERQKILLLLYAGNVTKYLTER